MSWFRKIDRDKNILAGREILEREISRHGLQITKEQLPSLIKDVLKRYNAKDHNDVFAGIGSGDIRINQVVNYLEERLKSIHRDEAAADKELIRTIEQRTLNRLAVNRRDASKSRVIVHGVGNLVTSLARCCHPIPGDEIIGYITQGRGISIHRCDCETVKNLEKACPERVIEAQWGESYAEGFDVTVGIEANDRSGLLRDITTIIAAEKINVLGVRSRSNMDRQTASIDIDMEVYNISDLTKMLSKLAQMPDVISARRL